MKDKSITLKTYSQLLTFLEEEKNLTTEQAAEIVSKSLRIVITNHDRTTAELVEATRAFIDKYGYEEEKPLFLDIGIE